MAQEDDDTLDSSGTLGSPRQRWHQLVRMVLTSISAGAVIMALGSSVTLIIKQYTNPPVQQVYWQIPDKEYHETLADLRSTRDDLARLQTLTTGESQAIAERAHASVERAAGTLGTLPYFTLEEQPDELGSWFPSLVTEAFAQSEAKEREPDTMQRIVVFALIGVVVLVLTLFVLLYMFTNDRAKKTFAEKTITTMIGFIFGLITGSMTGKYH